MIPLISMYVVYLKKWAGKTLNRLIYEDRKRGINYLDDKIPVAVYSNFMSNFAVSRREKGLSFLLTAGTKLLWIVLFADNQWLCAHIFIHIYVCRYVHLYTYTHRAKTKEMLTFSPAFQQSPLTRSLSELHLSSSAILHACVNRNTMWELQCQNNTLVSSISLPSFCRDANAFINIF